MPRNEPVQRSVSRRGSAAGRPGDDAATIPSSKMLGTFLMPSLLAFPDLKAKGIPFTRQHLHRLIKGGRFPAPLKLGEGTNRWLEHEIDQWLVDRAMERRSAPTAET